jgi:hypothetical protein
MKLEHLGVRQGTISKWLIPFGEAANTNQRSERSRISDEELATEADAFLAAGGTSSAKLNAKLRTRGTTQLRVDRAWRAAKQRQTEQEQLQRLTGVAEPEPAPPLVPTDVDSEEPTQRCVSCGRGADAAAVPLLAVFGRINEWGKLNVSHGHVHAVGPVICGECHEDARAERRLDELAARALPRRIDSQAGPPIVR